MTDRYLHYMKSIQGPAMKRCQGCSNYDHLFWSVAAQRYWCLSCHRLNIPDAARVYLDTFAEAPGPTWGRHGPPPKPPWERKRLPQ